MINIPNFRINIPESETAKLKCLKPHRNETYMMNYSKINKSYFFLFINFIISGAQKGESTNKRKRHLFQKPRYEHGVKPVSTELSSELT